MNDMKEESGKDFLRELRTSTYDYRLGSEGGTIAIRIQNNSSYDESRPADLTLKLDCVGASQLISNLSDAIAKVHQDLIAEHRSGLKEAETMFNDIAVLYGDEIRSATPRIMTKLQEDISRLMGEEISEYKGLRYRIVRSIRGDNIHQYVRGLENHDPSPKLSQECEKALREYELASFFLEGDS